MTSLKKGLFYYVTFLDHSQGGDGEGDPLTFEVAGRCIRLNKRGATFSTWNYPGNCKTDDNVDVVTIVRTAITHVQHIPTPSDNDCKTEILGQ